MAKANVVNTLVVPAETKVFPYYDDFDEAKNYHRVLYRPGYAVQARELTQSQTMLQNQIERFGLHIFEPGSSVIGGEIKFFVSESVNLLPQFANTKITAKDFVNKTITSWPSVDPETDVIARVIQASEENETDPPSLFFDYVSGEQFTPGMTIKIENEEVYANIVATSNALSNCVIAFNEDSIYFFNGHFVKTPRQVIVAEKYGTKANCRVGYELAESIVSEQSDSSLLDPALESSNYQAPGAARYKIDLVLARRDINSPPEEKFFEYVRVQNGIEEKNIKLPVYSEIEEVFARRTFDESGSYTVRPFNIIMAESQEDANNNVQAEISKGKAYIYGFEFEPFSNKTIIQVPRARTQANSFNYNLRTNYGNYVIVDNLNGRFNTDTMDVVDIHCVPYQNVNPTSVATYNTTKIGTARVRDVEFYSGDNTNLAAKKYEFYFFNTVFANNKTSTVGGAGNTLTTINLASSVTSTVDNAYQGATIRINSGASVGDRRTIVSYNGTTRLATVSQNFSQVPNNTSNYTIELDMQEAESFVSNPTYTPGATTSANANITIINKTSSNANLAVLVTEPLLSSLLFKLPEDYVVPASFADITWDYKKKYVTTFTAGSTTILLDSGETFIGQSGGETSASVLDSFFVINNATGAQVNVSANVTSTQATLTTGATVTNATVYAKIRNTSESSGRKTKNLVLANTLTFATESATGPLTSPTGSTVSLYLNSGQVVITNPTKSYTARESLYIADVSAVVKIYDLNGQSLPAAGASIEGLTDVTSRYSFDNGQRDTHYDYASIKLISGNAPPVGPLIVCCRYYKSDDSVKGYFSVDSYVSSAPPLPKLIESGVDIGDAYSLIPKYKGVIALRDCIDFRPVRQPGITTSPNFALSGIRIPVPASLFQLDYNYYLGRRDLITLSTDRILNLVQGVPSKFPQRPLPPNRSMVLHVLYIPPYTEYAQNVAIQYVENKRYTMRDIGLIDQRLKNVEDYVSLSLLESKTLDLSVKDVNGLDRSKNGVFVDSFIGHSLGDKTSPDYRISMDVNGRWSGDGMAMNTQMVKAIKLFPDFSKHKQFAGVTFAKDILTLNYVEEPAITQRTATKFTPVADLLFASYEGDMITNPEADVWTDTRNTVQINIINVTNEFNFQRVAFNFGAQFELEQEMRAQGMSEIDILNAWVRWFEALPQTGQGAFNQNFVVNSLEARGEDASWIMQPNEIFLSVTDSANIALLNSLFA